MPLTDQLRQGVQLAVEQAKAWEHDYVGTEHLLYGLTRLADANVAFILEQLGVAPDTVQGEVLRMLRIEDPGA